MIEYVDVLVEEPSAEAALRVLLPKILGKTAFRIISFTSKDQLLRKLATRLKGYAAAGLPHNHRVVVIVDRDNDNCVELKAKLEQAAFDAGLATRARPSGSRFSVVTRIAIEELEAWFFGDWAAVRAVYPRVKRTVPSQAKYRAPDGVRGGTWEAFERVLQDAGYFSTGLRKIEAAQGIAAHMTPAKNTSPRFRSLYAALLEMAS